ncbi:YceI family protein [Pseudoglutamicibacter albus]|uniref:Polyisoprenoid-binding protein YceI n=1 Tax=Pseudoglutamicibacter albus TaxID=98671 RepID=A0ABU1Z0R1_9MICC|nr:YceI family protein [Pseudoglutamicibacter albus]MCG7304081.1 YceI family protein [Pseudoglutamicibacter albus]MDR7294198.1 polyisoprenoid-binding protein YceI [Pseudoglutamicibacter albus]
MSALPLNLTPGTWNLDAAHTEIGFSVRHAAIARTHGRFTADSGVLTVGESLEDTKLEVTLDVASVNTSNEGRDEHLRSADFFDTATHPKAHFVSTKISGEGSALTVDGEFTLRGTTKPLTLEVEFAGVVTDPMGATRCGGEATAELSRKEFGLTWNAALETGGVMVGDKVRLQIDAEFIKDNA